MKFVNLGTRNKGLFWEYLAAHSFITMRIPGSAFTIPSTLSVGEGLANKHCHDPAVIDAYCKDLFWKELDNGVYTSGFFQDIAEGISKRTGTSITNRQGSGRICRNKF